MELSKNYFILFEKVDLQSEEKNVVDEFQIYIIDTIDFICILKMELSKIHVLFKENPSKIYEIICQKKKELCEIIQKCEGFYQAVVELNGTLMEAHQKGNIELDELTNRKNNLEIELKIFEERLKKDQDELEQLKTLSVTQETEVETAKTKLQNFTEKLKLGVAVGFMAVVVALHIASPESTQAIQPDTYQQIENLSVTKATAEQREKIIQMINRRETLLEIIEKEKENVIILKHRNYQTGQELIIAKTKHINQKAKLDAFAKLINIGCNFHNTLIQLKSPLDDISNIYETNIDSKNTRFKEKQEKKFEEKFFKRLEYAHDIYRQFHVDKFLNPDVIC